MPEGSPTPTATAEPLLRPLRIRRVLQLVVVMGVFLAIAAIGRGLWLSNWAIYLNDLTGTLFGLGMLVLAALPPAIAVFFARHLLRKGGSLMPIGLGVRLGGLLSFTAVVAALYVSTIFDNAPWLDAQAGVTYLLMPIATLVIAAISSVCGAVTGGLIAKLTTD